MTAHSVMYLNVGNLPKEKAEILARETKQKIKDEFGWHVLVMPVREGITRIEQYDPYNAPNRT